MQKAHRLLHLQKSICDWLFNIHAEQLKAKPGPASKSKPLEPYQRPCIPVCVSILLKMKTLSFLTYNR